MQSCHSVALQQTKQNPPPSRRRNTGPRSVWPVLRRRVAAYLADQQAITIRHHQARTLDEKNAALQDLLGHADTHSRHRTWYRRSTPRRCPTSHRASTRGRRVPLIFDRYISIFDRKLTAAATATQTADYALPSPPSREPASTASPPLKPSQPLDRSRLAQDRQSRAQKAPFQQRPLPQVAAQSMCT